MCLLSKGFAHSKIKINVHQTTYSPLLNAQTNEFNLLVSRLYFMPTSVHMGSHCDKFIVLQAESSA